MLHLASAKRLASAFAALLVLCAVLVAVHAPAPQAATPVVRAAFYYPWYPDAWNQSGVDPFSQYQPSDGYYSSADPTVVKQQIAAMQYGNLDAGIISWWGQGSQEDSVVPTDLAAADGTGFKWSLYYEPEGYGDPSVAQIQSDLSLHQTAVRIQPQLPDHRREAGHLRLRRPLGRVRDGPALE